MSDIRFIEEVSQRTGLSVASLRWMRHMGQGPRSFRLGRRVVYRAEDVDAWIDAQHAKGVGMAAEDESPASA